MIITCPHCQTKYQVTYEAIGATGRKVQCAHCRQAWKQAAPKPEATQIRDDDDRLFGEIAEDILDEVMMAEASKLPRKRRSKAEEEEATRWGKDDDSEAESDVTWDSEVIQKAAETDVAAEAPSAPVPTPAVATKAEKPKPTARVMDAAELKRKQKAFSRRQNAMFSRLPMARLRRTARIVGVVLLAAMLGTLYFARVQLVERYPDLAGVYQAVGLGVNVVGLDFSNLQTLKTLNGGNEVLVVSAQIVGIMQRPVRVPPVVVSLLDGAGHTVYEWSVAPRVEDLMAGERATFETRLSLPPGQAERVRLSFATANVQSEASSQPMASRPATVPAVEISGSVDAMQGAPTADHPEE